MLVLASRLSSSNHHEHLIIDNCHFFHGRLSDELGEMSLLPLGFGRTISYLEGGLAAHARTRPDIRVH